MRDNSQRQRRPSIQELQEAASDYRRAVSDYRLARETLEAKVSQSYGNGRSIRRTAMAVRLSKSTVHRIIERARPTQHAPPGS
jgi:hypothetical protein